MSRPVLRAVHLILVLSCFLHLGVIRKNYDPIVDTETDPIDLQKKMDQIKGGEKGAPKPSFQFYKKEKFLTKTAVEEDEELRLRQEEGDLIPELGAPIPEDLSGTDQDEEAWWEEDWGYDTENQEDQGETWSENW